MRRATNGDVRYLGSLLMPVDEVVFFHFEGASAAAVRQASVAAELPFERILESVSLSDTLAPSPDRRARC